MESPNPRRRQASIAPTPTLLSTTGFQKGSTFHSPSSPSTNESDPILSVATLPQRSSTCAEQLEALITTNKSRIAALLNQVDRSFSDLTSYSEDSQETILVEPEPEPFPQFMLDAINQNEPKDIMEIDTPAPRRKHHASDSGIGSTETSEASVVEKKAPATPGQIQSGINGNSNIPPRLGSTTQHVLSEYACRQIQKHIILPIVREEKLKSFHSLVHGLPYRVARKEITCLRDLEKVILWLAPVRQYAAHMAAERAQAGKNANASATTNSKLTLVGGLSQTGRPAELVRSVNGKSISLRTGEEVNMEEYKTGIKRSFEQQDLDDDLERSMARRKKNALPIIQTCKECGKSFNRPCDLTKHEKTHSRPWKCDEVGCKYHTYGWPTEKERDRHMNDKHSAAPKMYKCSYSPCPYESKRESNCKQHMEKAHGFVYVRAKNNGKVRAPSTVGAPTSPQMSTPGSYAYTAPTPDYSDIQSMNGSTDDSGFDFSGIPNIGYVQEATNFGEIFGPAGNDFNFADPPFAYTEAGPSNSHKPLYDSNAATPPMEENSIFGTDFDWSNTNMDFTAFNAQIPTPALTHELAFTSSATSVHHSPPSTCLSPHGHGDAMLFSPISHSQHDFHDEGYSELTQGFRPVHDFNLYSGTSSGTLSPGMTMFEDLSAFEKTSQMVSDSQMTFMNVM